MKSPFVRTAQGAIIIGLAAALVFVWALGPREAEAATINVLTVDCTPLTSPGPGSFGPTNTMGMALQSVDQGADFNITEDTPAVFRARSAASLAAFDLIAVNNNPTRLGDGCVAGAGTGLGTTWQSVVGVNSGGRVVLNSHDAVRFHMTAPTPGGPLFTGFEPFGAPDLVRQAALWAGGGSQTGLLIFAEGFGSGLGWDNPELNLPGAWGITDLLQSGGTCGGYTDILPGFAAHPIYVGLSDARFAANSISSFSANICDGSFHESFGSHNAAIFTPTEVVINSSVPDVGNFGLGAVPAAGPDGTPITLIRDEGAAPPTPPAVGGIVELRTGADAPADSSGSSSARDYAAPMAAVAAAALLALAAGGWYARRRWLR